MVSAGVGVLVQKLGGDDCVSKLFEELRAVGPSDSRIYDTLSKELELEWVARAV